MKNAIIFSFVLMMFSLTSCELIGDIFSAGFYTALFLVGLVVVIILYFVLKSRRRR